jgi:TPR repeat protein
MNPPKSQRLLIIGGLALCVAAGVLVAGWPRTPAATAAAKTEPPPAVDVPATQAKAEAGEAHAQQLLGSLYAKGHSVKQSYPEAAKWYQLAAAQGDAAAQRALGELYEAGQGVPLDNQQAAQWYRRAAEQGDAAGQYSLAVLYVTGNGVPRDIAEALKWYRQAAAQGNAMAQYSLGMRLKEGDGLPADLIEAYKWLTLAAAQGVGDAETARKELKSRLARPDIAEGERRVAAFTPQKAAPLH